MIDWLKNLVEFQVPLNQLVSVYCYIVRIHFKLKNQKRTHHQLKEIYLDQEQNYLNKRNSRQQFDVSFTSFG